MKSYVLERTQKLNCSLQEAWDFFSSPSNLKVITPDYMGFDITSDVPEKMYTGLIITYIVKPLLGIPMNWMTEIKHVDELRYFVDEQRMGPYKIWHHEHHFTEIEDGVLMKDKVSYALPLGVLGTIAHPIIVKNKLNEIFDYRYQKVEELFNQKKAVEVA